LQPAIAMQATPARIVIRFIESSSHFVFVPELYMPGICGVKYRLGITSVGRILRRGSVREPGIPDMLRTAGATWVRDFCNENDKRHNYRT
jgi:hypothetical protein